MKETGVLDVYFEEEIQIVVTDPEEFSVVEAKRVLTESGVEFTTLAPAPGECSVAATATAPTLSNSSPSASRSSG